MQSSIHILLLPQLEQLLDLLQDDLTLVAGEGDFFFTLFFWNIREAKLLHILTSNIQITATFSDLRPVVRSSQNVFMCKVSSLSTAILAMNTKQVSM